MNKNVKKVLMIVIPVLLVILIALCIVLILVLPKDKPVINVENVTLNQTEYTLEEGDTYKLEATVTPDDAANKSVTWTSSDEAVATVSDEGLVTAVAQGQATIRVITVDGGKNAACIITVIMDTIPVNGVQLNHQEYTLTVGGGSLQLEATVLPANATDKTVTWKSSKEDVAVVSDEGVVTAIAAGTTLITVKTNDGGITSACAVTVEAAPDQPGPDEPGPDEPGPDQPGPDEPEPTPVDSSNISIDIKETELHPGDTFTVNLEVTTSRTGYYWQSMDFAIVPLTEDGKRYNAEYSKYFEFVEGSYHTNLPEPDESDPLHRVFDNTSDHFAYPSSTVGYNISISLSGINKPTSESVIISFEVKVKDDAQAISSFNFGVAPLNYNHITYFKYIDEERTEIDDRASGRCTVTVNEVTVSDDKNVECFKVTPVEMKIIKDN